MLWPSVKSAIEKAVAQGRPAPHLTFAGHSLGGGAAALLSYAAAELLRERSQPDAVVSAVLFAAPNGGWHECPFVDAWAWASGSLQGLLSQHLPLPLSRT
jgi:fermentation-respiration switch protein FrsA (DUF1100 family)